MGYSKYIQNIFKKLNFYCTGVRNDTDLVDKMKSAGIEVIYRKRIVKFIFFHKRL